MKGFITTILRTMLVFLSTVSFLLTPALAAEETEAGWSSTQLAAETREAWIDEAIKMVEFIEANKLIVLKDDHEDYEKLVLNAPSDEKLDRLYELLVGAMFIRSEELTNKYMPIYVAEIEKSASIEHKQSLNVLTTGTQGYLSWAFEKPIATLEEMAFNKNTHPNAGARALTFIGYFYGYSKNTDSLVSTIQKMEALAKNTTYNIFIQKEIISLKMFLAFYTNDPEDMVKHNAEFIKLAYEADSLIYGVINSNNITRLVMEYGDIESIDHIDAINRRIAHMTGDNLFIFRAYTSCGETAVSMMRNTKALECFGEAAKYLDERSQNHIGYHLMSSIAYAQDGQNEIARSLLEKAKILPDVSSSEYFEKHSKWAEAEVQHSEGDYVDAYDELRLYFNNRVQFQKKELGEVSRSLRLYNEEKTALLKEKTNALAIKETMQKQIISRQRIVILLSVLLVICLLVFAYLQRISTKHLRLAREKTLAANKAIKKEARTDQLTRIGNRRAFYEACQDISENPDCQDFTLAILDLDGFKQINDTFGHDMGDLLIKETSQRLNHALSGVGQVFRLGGDEFAIIFLLPDDDNLQRFQSCLIEALKEPVKTETKSFDLNWSVGAFKVKGKAVSPLSLLLKHADYALYKAKEKKGPSIHIFSDVDFENMNYDTRLSKDVVWNLDTASFTMFGQVVVNLNQGNHRPFGVEALIRAQTRSCEVIQPEDFIWHAVSAGKTDMLTKLSLLKSIEMMDATGLECPLLFNLSREQITSPNVLETILEVLSATNFPANHLIIELSERTLNHDLSIASETLLIFQQHGIRIALDDFGSANTGFSSLLEFDFDLIKTDRNLLKSAMKFTRTEFLFSNLIEFSQKINVPCIIEGVETQSEVSFVKRLGGQVLQGYIFGRPEEKPKFRSNFNFSKVHETENKISNQKKLKKNSLIASI